MTMDSHDNFKWVADELRREAVCQHEARHGRTAGKLEVWADRIEALMKQGAVGELIEYSDGGRSFVINAFSAITLPVSTKLYTTPQDCEELRKELAALREYVDYGASDNELVAELRRERADYKSEYDAVSELLSECGVADFSASGAEYSLFGRVKMTLDESATLRAELEAEKAGAEAMRETLKAITDYVDKNTCRHEETHRGGAIWEICDHCGAKWADDEGGRPEFVEPKELVDAREALSSDAGREYAERLRKAEDERGMALHAAQDMAVAITTMESELEQYKRDGWKLVPVEPTEEMLEAGICELSEGEHYDNALQVYDAMLNAVPEK